MPKWEDWDKREKHFKNNEKGVSNSSVLNTLIPFYVGVGVGAVLIFGVVTFFGMLR